MKDFEAEEEEEEEKIRVEVGFFAHFFYQRVSLSRLVSRCIFLRALFVPAFLNWIFHLSSLFRGVFDVTDTSVSLYSSSFSRNGRQHCELGAWVKVESGETQKWFGRVRYDCALFLDRF